MTKKFWHRFMTSAGDNGGFTLLETMIGMMIFAVGISAVLYMEVKAINDHKRSQDHVEKVQGAVMQSEVITEALLYNDEDKLEDDGGNATSPDTYGPSDMPVGDSKDYAGYRVSEGAIVSQVKMIYMSKKTNANDKKITLGVAMPNRGKVK